MESRFQNTKLANNPENVHKCSYNKCSKVLNTFLFLFSSRILVLKRFTGIELTKHLSEQQTEKTPDQTASEEASIVGVFQGLHCLSRPFWCSKFYHPGPNVALMGPG